MSARVLLNLLNKLGKRDKMHLSLFRNEFMGRSTPTTAFMEQFDTLPIQYIHVHIEHMHEGVWLKKMF